jgi:hypothetical protein
MKDGVKVKYTTKESISKHGGTYYIFNEPVAINSLYMIARGDGNGAMLYEFEVFSTPRIKCELLDKSFNSMKIKYQLVCSSIDAIKYELYLNDNFVISSKNTEYEFKHLVPDTSYSVKVKAFINDTEYVEDSFIYKTSPAPLVLLDVNRTDKLKQNDSVVYTFSKDISTFVNNSATFFNSYDIDSNKLTVNLDNDYGSLVNIDFTVTDYDSKSLDISNSFETIKKGEILMNFDFMFVADWVKNLFASLRGSAKTILLIVLSLLGFIVGVFFLIGLGKKAVKKSK